ncbi:zinc finger with UFM1-specific peptidase domain protein isoform A [Alligator mississippiensis]|uniref:Zinc finger-containing ubiquitin peptidase 1 n=1 Tax=Alligator mississippiensis TaxID=8496 RepID=A0A151M352_ALLMI|nr:zinc finger with UFM1-specific peptidase domain protein isoform A [Alligator mississippiensis]
MQVCDVCGQELLSESEVRSHLARVHLGPGPPCPFCGFRGGGYDQLRRHIDAAHPEPGPQSSRPLGAATAAPGPSPLACPLCGEAAASAPGLEAHVQARHGRLLLATAPGNKQLYECPMCDLVCASPQILQEHVDLHLEECSFSEGINRQYGLDDSGGYKQQFLKNMEREVNRGRMQPFEYHKRKTDMMESLAFGVDDGKTKSSGVIEALCKYYQNEFKDVRRIWLSVGVDHFSSSLGDRGWGCGYRNFQMLLSSLLKNDMYNDCLQDHTLIPSIPKIQSMIEDAWKEGFDPRGASHFNNRLRGTKAWIGACEIYSLLTSLRLKCRVIDFHKPTGPMGTHPRLFEWVLSYYSRGREDGAKVVCTSKPPLYLQHQGHSRTVVGIEEKKNRTLCLLIFDPGCPSQEMQKLLRHNSDVTFPKQLQKFVGSLKDKQYQIVAVDGVLLPEEKAARLEASQVFTAEKIP